MALTGVWLLVQAAGKQDENQIRFGFTFAMVLLVLVSTIAGAAVTVTEFPISPANKLSLRYHVGFDGNLWFTEN